MRTKIKKSKSLNKGITLIELMAVIAIMIIIAAYFVANTRPSYASRLEEVAEQFASDMRLVRNMVIGRQVYKFSGDTNPVFPAGGYGVVYNNITNRYNIYAFKDADLTVFESVKEVILPADIKMKDANVAGQIAGTFLFAVQTERDATTSLILGTANQNFVVDVGQYPCTGSCPRASVLVGNQTADGIQIANVGTDYRVDVISGGSGGFCFLSGTKVLMADGSQKNIENVVAGDIILSADQATGRATVQEVDEKKSVGYYRIVLDNSIELMVTAEHPIYAKNKNFEGWASFDPITSQSSVQTPVRLVSEMDEIMTVDGWVDISKIEYTKGNVNTYNLISVDGGTFYANGIKVHNKKPPKSGGGGL